MPSWLKLSFEMYGIGFSKSHPSSWSTCVWDVRSPDCCLVRLVGKTHLFLKVILITRWLPWAFPCPLSFQHHLLQVAVRRSSTVFPWTRLRLLVFVLVLLSDVLGVEVFLLVPTASGDNAGPRFCAPLPPSPPRLKRIAFLKRADLKWQFSGPLFFGPRWSTKKSRWSRVGTSKIILEFYPLMYLVRWIMGRIGKVGREVLKKLDQRID